MEKKEQKNIYLDNAAATKVDERVVEAMLPYFTDVYGNPNASDFHAYGKEARDAVEQARASVAKLLGAESTEIFFTSSGTAANELALQGATADAPKDATFVTSAIEHPSVLGHLEGDNRTTVIATGDDGVVRSQDVAGTLTDTTHLVSIMYANNEIGTVQPIAQIGQAIKTHSKKTKTRMLFHTDATQAPLWMGFDVTELQVDLMTLDGQKIHGPKGVGVLYVREGAFDIRSTKKPGTENVPAIVGFAKALEFAEERRTEDVERVKTLRDILIGSVLKDIPGSVLNGSHTERLPNNAHISFEGMDGIYIARALGGKGIAVSTRSVCLDDALEGSPVVAHIAPERAGSGVRFSLSRYTTEEEIREVLKALKAIVGNNA